MYTDHFGFNEKPFNVTPDPRFLYLSPAHQEALASMIYGIKERRGFVSVIGEIGTGKTTLLHTLFRELGPEVTTVFIFNTKLNFIQLLQNILTELDITYLSNNKSALIYQLNDFLIKKLSLNENVALVIDEAQNLSATVLEEIRMLSNLETTTDKLLQIILVGQPELDFNLKSHQLRQLRQRIAINCYLTPLTNQEQMKYILHRLFVAGCENESIFSPKALELIYKNARGIPRIINILCDNALVAAYGKDLHIVNEEVIDEVISDFTKSNSPTKVSKNKPQHITIPKVSYGFRSILLIFFSLILALFILFGISFYVNNSFLINQYLTSLLTKEPISIQKKPEIISNASELPTIEESSSVRKESIVTTSQNPLFMNSAAHYQDFIKDQPTQEDQEPSVFTVEVTSSTIPPHQVERKMAIAKEGDIISALALREYGLIDDTLLDIIKSSNPDIVNLDEIEIGQTIIFPALELNRFIIETQQGSFSLHVETFSSYDSALRLHNELEQKGYSPSIVPVMITGEKKWYRVMVGEFTDRSQAIEFAKLENIHNSFTPLNTSNRY